MCGILLYSKKFFPVFKNYGQEVEDNQTASSLAWLTFQVVNDVSSCIDVCVWVGVCVGGGVSGL